MKILIIEDELPARAKLQDILLSIDPAITIVGVTGSVKDTLNWLRNNPAPDLAFVDIQLSDDHSFEIFEQYQVSFPVIFTTAYDKYVLASFEYNSIDYLLKPLSEAKVLRALNKVRSLEKHFTQGSIYQMLEQMQRPATRRILCKKGTEFVPLEMEDIAYFFTEHRIVFAVDHTGQRLIVDKTITELDQEIDHSKFFRLNRKYLASYRSIERFKSENGKVKVSLVPDPKEEVYVSKDTAPMFREWIGVG